ncbi:MAG: ABC transporter permease [Eubacteriales bacterium]|nr:ABC transporter permease [Eubacteriales bacterium]
MLNVIFLGIAISLMYAAPLCFTALGGVITQRAGVDNIGLEGMMAFGAFAAAASAYFSNNPWLGFLIGALAGGILALVHGFIAITLKGDQTISGIAINFIGLGLAIFFTRILFNGMASTDALQRKLPKVFQSLGFNFEKYPALRALEIDITVVLAIVAVFIVNFVLYKTVYGLRLRACGEHPAAADTMGVSVSKIRYSAVFLSGIFAGFGGGAMTLAVISHFTPTVISGQGFIALAAVIFGNWRPIGAALACLLFGFAQALAVLLSSYTAIPTQILATLPYILTLLVLILFVGRSVPPKANGQPYFKGEA